MFVQEEKHARHKVAGEARSHLGKEDMWAGDGGC